jgi:hypothetical protein
MLVLSIVTGERPERTAAKSDDDSRSHGSGDDWISLGPTSSEDSIPGTELAVLSESITETVTCLFLVSINIRKAAPMDRYARSDVLPPLDDRYDIDYVWQKFPHARRKPWLVERLGRAITRRRQYFTYRRYHHLRLAHVDTRTDPGIVPGGTRSQESQPRQDEDIPPVTGPESEARTSQVPTSATPYFPPGETRVEAQSELDRTESSFISSTPSESDAISIPAPPAAAAEGNPFECPYCFEILQLKGKNSWK